MDMSIYLTIGFICEAIVLWGYIRDEDQYTWYELLIGAVVDIIAWPIIIILSIIIIIKGR